MKNMQRCPKCEKLGYASENITHFRSVDDATDGGYAEQAISHKGWLWGGRRKGFLEAYVCNECGYVEFYVVDIPLTEQ